MLWQSEQKAKLQETQTPLMRMISTIGLQPKQGVNEELSIHRIQRSEVKLKVGSTYIQRI